MPRRHRRKPEDPARGTRIPAVASPLPSPQGWTAHRFRGGETGREYTCPRCKRRILATTEHVVARRTDDDTHRHWHSGCWESAVREGIERYRWT